MIKAFIKSVEIHDAENGLAQVVEYTRFTGNSEPTPKEEYQRLLSKPQPYGAALAHANALAEKHDVKVIDFIASNASVRFCKKQNKQVPA